LLILIRASRPLNPGALNSTIVWFNPQGPLTTEELAENLATYLIRGLCSGEIKPAAPVVAGL